MNEQSQDKWEFSANAEQYLSYLFLQDFQARYQQLMNALGSYIAQYDKFKSNFTNQEIRQQKEITIATIKANLAPVVYMLEAINSDFNKSNVASHHLNVLKSLNQKIINSKDIDIKDLEDINKHLSFVVSTLFLRPIMQKIPGRTHRIFGSVDTEE